MKISMTNEEVQKVRQAAVNSNHRDTVILYNSIFGKNPIPEITVQYTKTGAVGITVPRETSEKFLNLLISHSRILGNLANRGVNLGTAGDWKTEIRNFKADIKKVFRG